MMRVLIASGPFPLSKGEIVSSFVFDEATRICSRNVKVHAARGIRSIWDKRKNLTVAGITIHNFSRDFDFSFISQSVKAISGMPVSASLRPEIVLFTIPYSWFLSKMTKMYGIDLTHAHFAYPEGFAGLMSKRVTGTPLIVTLHGVDIITEPSVNYGIRLRKPYDEIVRKVLARADRVFAASRFVYREALNAGCSRKRLIYLANGVDLKRFNPKNDSSLVVERLGISHRPTILTLRAHEPKNGIEYLIKAVPFVLKEVPDAVFIIGGTGTLRTYHECLAHRLGVDKHCMFVGYISYEELPYLYAASDIFVIPSVIEAFGLVTIEAMASGKPVIGSSVGGIPDIIVDGVNGFLIRPRDEKEIADRIVTLIKNPEMRREMGANGRKTTEEKFDAEKRIEKIISVYHELA